MNPKIIVASSVVVSVLGLVVLWSSSQSKSSPLNDPASEQVASAKAPVDIQTEPSPNSAVAESPVGSEAPNIGSEITTLLRHGLSDQAMSKLAQWTVLDPAAAAEFVERLSDGERRVDAIRTVARTWAGMSSEDAIGWVKHEALGDSRSMVQEFVCYRVAEDDPVAAIRLATGSGAEDTFPLLANLTQQWAARDPAAAKAWTLSQPRGSARETLVARLALSLATQQPAEAGQLIVDEMAPGAAQDEAAMSVLFQWAVRDEAGAAEWVRHFPAGSLKQRAETELAGIADSKRGE